MRCDADMQVVGKQLQASARKDVLRNSLELQFRSQLRRARCVVDLAHQTTKVTVSGWNAIQGKRVTGISAGANAGPGSGRTGASALAAAGSNRSEHLSNVSVSTDQEAKAVADAAFDHRARRFVRVDGTAEGNPALRVGSYVKLTDLGPRFSNTYYVVHACHRFDLVAGYETDFSAQCAYLGGG